MLQTNQLRSLEVLTDEFEPEIPKGSAVVVDYSRVPDRPDDLVICELNFSEGSHIGPILTRLSGPTGRDQRGRFCKPGSPNEAFMLSCGFMYTREGLDRGCPRILGAVVGVHVRFAQGRAS